MTYELLWDRLRSELSILDDAGLDSIKVNLVVAYMDFLALLKVAADD